MPSLRGWRAHAAPMMSISIRSLSYHQNSYVRGCLRSNKPVPPLTTFPTTRQAEGDRSSSWAPATEFRQNPIRRFPKVSPRSVLKRNHFGLCARSHLVEHLQVQKGSHLLFTLNWNFWELRVQNSSYPSYNKYFLIPIFGPSK